MIANKPEDVAWKARAIFAARDKLVDRVCSGLEGMQMTPSLASTFADTVEHTLSWFDVGKGVRSTALLHSGEMMTVKRWRDLCWQIAANRTKLARGEPLIAFAISTIATWTAFEIIGIAPCDIGDKGTGIELEFRALTGISAGYSIKNKVSEPFAAKIASVIGFNYKEPYDGNALRLFGLTLLGCVVENRIERCHAVDQIKTANRRIIRMRRRDVPNNAANPPTTDNNGLPLTRTPKLFGCPRGFLHECWECTVKRQDCDAGY